MSLRALADVSPAAWFVAAAAPWWSKVCLGAPGFDAYGRLQLIPADEHDDINLTRLSTDALRRILPGHTATPEECYFAQWNGSAAAGSLRSDRRTRCSR